MAGDTNLAKSMLKELRRVLPNVSLAWIRSWLPVRDPGEREHFLEGLLRARPGVAEANSFAQHEAAATASTTHRARMTIWPTA
jgi:hypothetical protein